LRPSLRAVIFYLYTEEIDFAFRKSTVKGTHKTEPASAKSVYLAADKVI